MSVQYQKPPLIEAIFEANFIAEAWDMTMVGDFYKQINHDFPIKMTKEQAGLGIEINQTGANIVNRNQKSITQFFNEQKNQLVQVSTNMLAVNSLPPYMSWDNFKALIVRCLAHYQEVAKPKGFASIMLRYINKVNIGEECSYDNMRRYFHLLPHIPDGLPHSATSLNTNIEMPFDERSNILSIVQATLLPEMDMQAPVLFDLNFICIKPQTVALEHIENWLEHAHTQIERIFEDSLTTEAKQSFR
jgi:uncharacterized protein (TIGR04255 family)